MVTSENVVKVFVTPTRNPLVWLMPLGMLALGLGYVIYVMTQWTSLTGRLSLTPSLFNQVWSVFIIACFALAADLTVRWALARTATVPILEARFDPTGRLVISGHRLSVLFRAGRYSVLPPQTVTIRLQRYPSVKVLFSGSQAMCILGVDVGDKKAAGLGEAGIEHSDIRDLVTGMERAGFDVELKGRWDFDR